LGASEYDVLRIVFLIFLGILALNAAVILALVAILVLDHLKSRRRRAKETPTDDAHAKAS
jgi:hypothetical protein